jgi:hypothetical protein
MERHVVTDASAARAELTTPRTMPAWREGRHSYPFHELSADEFEVFCFVLLLKEHPSDPISYYGKTGDAGRDIIHIRDGRVRLIQCKRYGENVTLPDVRRELAKLCVNVFSERIPQAPDEVVFYVVPDVTAPAADLIKEQSRWRQEAPKALADHLGEPPSPELLAFANSWWPEPDYVTAQSLTERARKFDDLRDEFFAVRKVIDASYADVEQLVQKEVASVKDMLAPLVPVTSPCGPCRAPEPPSQAPLDAPAILQSFEDASGPLLRWPTTLGDDRWLERAELEQIGSRISTGKSSTTLLIGPPGSGKSALLARLGRACVDAGRAVLAVKADLLSANIDSIGTLSEQLHLPAAAAECVAFLAESQKVVVLIDQLDALADLVDLRPGRLNALLQLIKHLNDQPNVHVVSSCRVFEHGHDVRLTSIDAEVVPLSLPGWEAVAEALRSRQIDASRWPKDFRELLQTPQHLKIFLQRLRGSAEDRIFTTYQQLLDDLWARCVTNPDGPDGRSRLIMDLADQMAARETLWLPLVRFEDRQELLEALEADDILTRSENGFSVGFRHQTIFEHARARAFACGKGSLADHVFARQDSLFVRPVLWTSLHYLRGADPAGYEAEMERLWSEPVRKHLRHLLIDFLGQVSSPPPTDRERLWLIAYLQMAGFRAKVLAAVRGNIAWFSILAGSHLPAVMRLPSRDAWLAVGVIGAAWADDRAGCLALLEDNWLPDPTKDQLTWRTLEQLPSWDAALLAVALRVVRRAGLALSAVSFLASRVAASSPDLAVRLLAAKFVVDLERLEAMPDPQPDPPPPEADDIEHFIRQASHRPWERFEHLLDDQEGLHDLPALAEEAPAEFLRLVWPWFVRVVDHVAHPAERRVVAYRREHGIAMRLRNNEDAGMYPVVRAMEIAVSGGAEQDAQAFLAFLAREQNRDSMIVQRLLCRGLVAVVQTHAAAALRFLCDDPRRLVLGSYDDEHADTCALLSALGPQLDAAQMGELESVILAWERYGPEASDLPADARFQSNKWEREHRLRLLAAIPPEGLSASTRALVAGEASAFPHHREAGVRRVQGGFVVSPMSAGQMSRAKDQDILNLFDVLRDRPARQRHFLVGGIDEAAHQFGIFAKEHPHRAAALIRQCPPARQDQPVSEALVPLSESTYPTDDLFALVTGLDGRGFQSHEFRDSAARAIGNRATEGVGLPDPICTLLERWLAEPWGQSDAPGVEEHQRGAEQAPRSMFWQPGHLMDLPFGTYELLRSLTYGYLLREPAATGRWMKVLEEHVERHDGAAQWKALTRDLQHLHLCEHARATRFLTRLFGRFPDVRDSLYGMVLLTHAWWFLPPALTHQLMRDIRGSGWGSGAQAYGELLALRTLVFPQDEEASRELEQALGSRADGDAGAAAVRLGIAFTAAQLWRDAQHHDRAAGMLERLVPLADDAISHALMGAFCAVDVLSVDAATIRFLRALLSHPRVLRARDAGFLVERLQDVLSTEPDLASDLASELVRIWHDDLTDIRTAFAGHTANLTNVALTLQRLGGPYRSRGLDLFERLLDLGVHDAQATLNEIDKRPLNVPRPVGQGRRRVRRRRGTA